MTLPNTQAETAPEGAEAPETTHPPAPSAAPAPSTPPRVGENAGALVLGVLLIVLGAVFLARPVLPAEWSQFGWPLFILLPGLALFLAVLAGGRSWGGLAVPASIVTAVGLILFVQNALNLWQTWAYAWALIFPTSVGLGLWIQGEWFGDPALAKQGRTMLLIGASIFAVGIAFFEGLLNLSGLAETSLVRYGGALILIAVGAILLLARPLRPSPHP